MDKKIGILTFHRAFSYGAVLQAYALQNFLRKNNIENEIIDYNCEYMVEHYQKIIRKTNGNRLKGFLWSLLTADKIRKERKVFSRFVEKHLRLSKPYDKDNIDEVADQYSRFIVGSDQVWSPTCVGFDPVYFLPFAKPFKKYSYSASIATNEITESIKEEFKRRISDFKGLSLREKSGKEIVEKLTGQQATIHIDPTLLMEKDDWDTLAEKSEIREPYILIFTVLKQVNLIDYALKLSEKTGMKVIFLNNNDIKKIKGITYIDPVSPGEFISMIKNASYVCTNSFHGTAFSLIYEKDFVVETQTGSGENIRSQEIMTKLGLASRILSRENTPDINEKSNWMTVRNKLKEEKEKSLQYLLSID